MSRNKGRLTANVPRQSTEPPPNPAPVQLDFAVPTELVNLPSGGNSYPEGHPLFNRDVIEIRYMTAKDEDILTSPSLLQRGLALDRLLSSVILDKSINPAKMLSCDRNAVLIASRITGYGPDYVTEYNCPKCGEANEETFDVSKYTILLPQEADLLEQNVDREGDLFVFTIKGLNVRIAIKTLSYDEELKIAQMSERKLELGLEESITTDTLKAIIVSVNGTPDARIINHVAEQMPVMDSRRIRKIHSLVTPAVNLEAEVTCEKCTKTSKLEVPFTTGFFWPKL